MKDLTFKHKGKILWGCGVEAESQREKRNNEIYTVIELLHVCIFLWQDSHCLLGMVGVAC